MRRNCHKLSPPRQNNSTLEVSQSDELNASSILFQRSVSAFSLSNNSDNHMNTNFNICQWNARSIRNKATICSDYTLEHDIDIMFLTETWLNENDQVAIGEVTPPVYVFLNIPRESGDDMVVWQFSINLPSNYGWFHPVSVLLILNMPFWLINKGTSFTWLCIDQHPQKKTAWRRGNT